MSFLQGAFRKLLLVKMHWISMSLVVYLFRNFSLPLVFINLQKVSKIYRFLISSLGFKVESIKYQSPAREYGKTKYSGKHLWRLAISSVIGFSTFPLSAIFIGGLLTFGISMSSVI